MKRSNRLDSTEFRHLRGAAFLLVGGLVVLVTGDWLGGVSAMLAMVLVDRISLVAVPFPAREEIDARLAFTARN